MALNYILLYYVQLKLKLSEFSQCDVFCFLNVIPGAKQCLYKSSAGLTIHYLCTQPHDCLTYQLLTVFSSDFSSSFSFICLPPIRYIVLLNNLRLQNTSINFHLFLYKQLDILNFLLHNCSFLV